MKIPTLSSYPVRVCDLFSCGCAFQRQPFPAQLRQPNHDGGSVKRSVGCVATLSGLKSLFTRPSTITFQSGEKRLPGKKLFKVIFLRHAAKYFGSQKGNLLLKKINFPLGLVSDFSDNLLQFTKAGLAPATQFFIERATFCTMKNQHNLLLHKRRWLMELFIKRFSGLVKGTLSGFD